MLSLPASVISFVIGPNIFLSIIFSNNQPIFLPRCERPSFTLIRKIWQNHCSVYFNLYIFEHRTVRQRMLHRMVANIPWLQSAFNFFMNEILFFYDFSQILEFSHTLKDLFHIFVLWFYSALSAWNMNIYLVFSALTSRPFSLRAATKVFVYIL